MLDDVSIVHDASVLYDAGRYYIRAGDAFLYVRLNVRDPTGVAFRWWGESVSEAEKVARRQFRALNTWCWARNDEEAALTFILRGCLR